MRIKQAFAPGLFAAPLARTLLGVNHMSPVFRGLRRVDNLARAGDLKGSTAASKALLRYLQGDKKALVSGPKSPRRQLIGSGALDIGTLGVRQTRDWLRSRVLKDVLKKDPALAEKALEFHIARTVMRRALKGKPVSFADQQTAMRTANRIMREMKK